MGPVRNSLVAAALVVVALLSLTTGHDHGSSPTVSATPLAMPEQVVPPGISELFQDEKRNARSEELAAQF